MKYTARKSLGVFLLSIPFAGALLLVGATRGWWWALVGLALWLFIMGCVWWGINLILPRP